MDEHPVADYLRRYKTMRQVPAGTEIIEKICEVAILNELSHIGVGACQETVGKSTLTIECKFDKCEQPGGEVVVREDARPVFIARFDYDNPDSRFTRSRINEIIVLYEQGAWEQRIDLRYVERARQAWILMLALPHPSSFA